MALRLLARHALVCRARISCEGLEHRTLLSTLSLPASSASNPTFDSLIRASEVRLAYQVDGSGLAAAVIDTGVDYNSPALGGGFGPGFKVDAGFDLAMNDSDPFADTWSHGTNVSGLIASQATNAPGVAPGANLVALRVFGNNNQGDFASIANALQWVIDHHDPYQITVVNLSVSDGGNYIRDFYSNDGGIGQRIAGLINQLALLRIPVVTATGNGFNGKQGEGFVSILPQTISVTASNASDQLVWNAQRLGAALGGISATDLAAPGEGLLTTGEYGGTTNVSGTSFSAPLVTGSIVLLQQIYRNRFGLLPTVSDLVGWLKQGADPIVDSVTGISLGRLNVARSATLIPCLPSGTGATLQNTSTLTVASIVSFSPGANSQVPSSHAANTFTTTTSASAATTTTGKTVAVVVSKNRAVAGIKRIGRINHVKVVRTPEGPANIAWPKRAQARRKSALA